MQLEYGLHIILRLETQKGNNATFFIIFDLNEDLITPLRLETRALFQNSASAVAEFFPYEVCHNIIQIQNNVLRN